MLGWKGNTQIRQLLWVVWACRGMLRGMRKMLMEHYDLSMLVPLFYGEENYSVFVLS